MGLPEPRAIPGLADDRLPFKGKHVDLEDRFGGPHRLATAFPPGALPRVPPGCLGRAVVSGLGSPGSLGAVALGVVGTAGRFTCPGFDRSAKWPQRPRAGHSEVLECGSRSWEQATSAEA